MEQKKQKWFEFIDEILNKNNTDGGRTNGTMERFSKQEGSDNNQ